MSDNEEISDTEALNTETVSADETKETIDAKETTESEDIEKTTNEDPTNEDPTNEDAPIDIKTHPLNQKPSQDLRDLLRLWKSEVRNKPHKQSGIDVIRAILKQRWDRKQSLECKKTLRNLKQRLTLNIKKRLAKLEKEDASVANNHKIEAARLELSALKEVTVDELYDEFVVLKTHYEVVRAPKKEGERTPFAPKYGPISLKSESHKRVISWILGNKLVRNFIPEPEKHESQEIKQRPSVGEETVQQESKTKDITHGDEPKAKAMKVKRDSNETYRQQMKARKEDENDESLEQEADMESDDEEETKIAKKDKGKKVKESVSRDSLIQKLMKAKEMGMLNSDEEDEDDSQDDDEDEENSDEEDEDDDEEDEDDYIAIDENLEDDEDEEDEDDTQKYADNPKAKKNMSYNTSGKVINRQVQGKARDIFVSSLNGSGRFERGSSGSHDAPQKKNRMGQRERRRFE
eukprot:TRINITY_DN2147_c0_g1_i2.p1 TRINITY_DN2147_c0_g1~~TRINITY_DN2147_c0_g1_i2.p1  ORF type:complete len:463 (-),score=158.11 TRINITY_DN2147_c0_g1_i2:111-1499(-)